MKTLAQLQEEFDIARALYVVAWEYIEDTLTAYPRYQNAHIALLKALEETK